MTPDEIWRRYMLAKRMYLCDIPVGALCHYYGLMGKYLDMHNKASFLSVGP